MKSNDPKRLVRPRSNRKVAGVALSIARYVNIDVTVVRIIWVLLLLPGGLPGLIPYVLLWILIPSED